MLLFIVVSTDTGHLQFPISIHLMLLFIFVCNIRKWIVYKFQYISCYCLSVIVISTQRYLRNFNTSHVTVYRFHNSRKSYNLHYFNTSHVTVYLHFLSSDIDVRFISIHLMLLFIVLDCHARL